MEFEGTRKVIAVKIRIAMTAVDADQEYPKMVNGKRLIGDVTRDINHTHEPATRENAVRSVFNWMVWNGEIEQGYSRGVYMLRYERERAEAAERSNFPARGELRNCVMIIVGEIIGLVTRIEDQRHLDQILSNMVEQRGIVRAMIEREKA